MFDLERSIAEWRRQMQAGGLKAVGVLDELESHLREGVENQVSLGLDQQKAFETTVRNIGKSHTLRREFSRAGGPRGAMIKHFALTVAGIPDPYADLMIDESYAAGEQAWVTYLKATAFALPAVTLWFLNVVCVVPKFQELCRLSGITFPGWIYLAMILGLFVTQYAVLLGIALILILALLEWRVRQWPRYRRAFCGLFSIALNVTVLWAITMLGVGSIVAAFDWAKHLNPNATRNPTISQSSQSLKN